MLSYKHFPDTEDDLMGIKKVEQGWSLEKEKKEYLIYYLNIILL